MKDYRLNGTKLYRLNDSMSNLGGIYKEEMIHKYYGDNITYLSVYISYNKLDIIQAVADSLD